MSRPPARALEHIVRAGEDAVEWSEQKRRVEVALHAAIGADLLPRLVERRPPVGADHVAARLAQLPQDRAGADAEMNGGHTCRLHPLENPSRVRQDELAVVAR